MKAALAALLVTAATSGAGAGADPIRLRADALATTSSPAGLLVLEADGKLSPDSSAEAVVWMAGARTPGQDAAGDVLVIAVRAQTRTGRASARFGRFVSTLGALQPVHVDGAAARLRLPRRLALEVVGGLPVTPDLAASHVWGWVGGARLSRRIGDGGSVGIAYAQRRDDGELTSEELGLDAGVALGAHTDAGARLAYDLADPGIAEVALTSSHRRGALRAEVYAIQRGASHLLPASSLFSVIGDTPSQRAGTVLTWRAAPRLDLIADVGARRVDDVGVELVGRARLRLDDRGTSALTGEVRRSGVGDDAWTGARGTARIALPGALSFSTELELVRPDVDRGRGALWPWALAAMSWDRGAWIAAVAVEASASAEYQHRFDVLAQLGRRWGKP